MARYSRRRARRARTYRKRGRKTRRTRGPRSYRARKSVNMHHYKRKVIWNMLGPSNQTLGCIWNSNTSVANPQNVTGALGGSEFLPPTVSQNGCALAWGMNFSLDRTDSYTEFGALYDQYRIRGVKIKITYGTTESTGAASQFNIPTFKWYRDNDDSDNPTTLATIREFSQRPYVGSRQLANGRPVKIYLGKPNKQIAVADASGTGTYSQSIKSGWINLSDTDVAHYGLKCLLLDYPLSPASASTYNPILRMEITYYISLRGVR